jgi:type I restriction enzyme, S subunit
VDWRRHAIEIRCGVLGQWLNPWVSPKDMKAEIIHDTEDYITEAAVASSATKFVPAGSVLMVMRSGILRHTFPVATNADRVTVNQDLRALIPAAGINPRYIAHYLRGIQRQVLDRCSKDGTTVQSVEVSALERVRVPIAPAAEQPRIVARIDALFAEIAEGEGALQRARQGLDTWRRALLKAAVTGELTRDWRAANRPTAAGADLLARIHAERQALGANHSRGRRAGTAEPLITSALPRLPEGWVWARLHELGEVSGGLTKNPDREGFPHKLPYLRVGNVQMGRLDLTEVTEIGVRPEEQGRLLLGQNDLLIVEGNGSIDQIGRCALWNGEIRPCVHQNHIIKVRFSEPALSSWALRWLLSPSGREAIKNVASSTSGLHTLSISKIQNLPIPVPPLEEACVVLRVLEASLAIASDAKDECEKLMRDRIALRQSILKAAFEGRLVPQDPTDDPATALLARLRGGRAGANASRGRRGRKRNRPETLELPLFVAGDHGSAADAAG